MNYIHAIQQHENSALLASKETLSIRQYPYLAQWLSWSGVVASNTTGIYSTYISPVIIPIVFLIASIFQDVFCYTKYSGCGTHAPIYGPSNVTYNDKFKQTIFIWLGILIGILALYINMMLYARSGKLEKLFCNVSLTPYHSRTVRRTIIAWAIAWFLLVVGALLASFIYTSYRVRTDCAKRYFVLCMVPQAIQIISGTSVVFTGVGLTFIKCSLLRLFIYQQAEPQSKLISAVQFRQYTVELDKLRAVLKEVSLDTQLGNAIALAGGFICIFASVWTFAEEYTKHNNSIPIEFSISIWTLILSLVLTFIVLFSFSYVTRACNRLKEHTKECVVQCIIHQDEDREVSLSEFFVMTTAFQRKFGFKIAGLLMQPDVVRALATAGGTLALTIVKLVA